MNTSQSLVNQTLDPNIEIRHPGIADREILINLYLKMIQYLEQFEHDILPTRSNAEFMVDTIFLPAALKGEGVLIASYKGQIAGAVFWAVQHSQIPLRFKYAIGYGTYIEAEFRNQKLGKLLRTQAIVQLKEHQVEKILYFAHFKNTISLQTSERLGFTPFIRTDILDIR